MDLRQRNCLLKNSKFVQVGVKAHSRDNRSSVLQEQTECRVSLMNDGASSSATDPGIKMDEKTEDSDPHLQSLSLIRPSLTEEEMDTILEAVINKDLSLEDVFKQPCSVWQSRTVLLV